MTDRIRVQRTRDYAEVFAIVSDPWIWPSWSGGQKQAPAECPVPLAPEREYWLIASSEAKGPFGAIRFEHQSSVTVEGHFGFRRRAWGRYAAEGGALALEWLFTATPYRKVVGFTPACNRPATRYSERLGFVREGLLTQAFEYSGELVDLVVFGMTKGEWNGRR